MDELYAYWGKTRAGVFRRTSPTSVSFTYDQDAPQTPISLSLPRDGSGSGDAHPWLENLLPNNPRVITRWAQEAGVEGDNVFGLLAAFGEDVTVAVTVSADPELPRRHEPQVLPATDDEIAVNVRSRLHG